MRPPFKKPSERQKRPPKDEGVKLDDNPLDILRKWFYRVVNTRLGWRLGAAILLLVALWVGWTWIAALPGADWVLAQINELRSVPQSRGDRFAIVIPRLDNDKDGAHRRLISDALRGQFGKDEVEVLLVDRSISIDGNEKPQEAIKSGHERARGLLRQSKANVMIWGQVLDAKTDAPMRLHWTLDANTASAKASEKYRPSDATYDLPTLFWTDLADVLSLLASSQGASFSDKQGSYVADQLKPFIERVRQLVASGKLAGLQKATMQVILADGLATFGEQSGDERALDEAISTYRQALKEYTHERVPLDWAMTQNNLGNAL
ncbi:MAG: hypothetical protein ABI589_15650 [Burkholderiales bacterium]